MTIFMYWKASDEDIESRGMGQVKVCYQDM